MGSPVPPIVQSGKAPFDYPAAGKPLETWYKITGDLTPASIPLVILHGGPGVGSAAYNPLADLTVARNIPIIQYDQVGCGNSTRLREKASAGAEFWNDGLFVAELESLLTHLGLNADDRQYDLLGHSWGGMFGARFAAKQPKGLRKFVIMSSAASIALWVAAQGKLRETLPAEIKDTLQRCEEGGRTDSQEYQQAMGEYYARFMCRLNPMPAEIVSSFQLLEEDPTVYAAMWGPSEFYVNGTLEDWSVLEEISKITCPTLLLNGRYDEAQDSGMLPFFQGLKTVKWIQFASSAHMAQYEERDRFMDVVGRFLS